jgi:hypothetical protein
MKINPIIGPSHLVGVEARRQGDGTWRFFWAHLRKQKTGVLVERQGSDVADVQALMISVGPRYALALVVTGERILLRDMPNPFDVARDLGKLLPNARPEDLIISCCLHAERTEVGVVRAQIVADLLSELDKAGMRVIRLFIGSSVRRALDGLVEDNSERQEEVHPAGLSYSTRTPSNATSVLFGTESVDTSSLLAFSSAWQHWFHPLELTTSSIPQVVHAGSEERYRYLYELGLISITVVMLVLLVGDVWLRSHLDKRQAYLQNELEQQRQARFELDSLGEAVRVRKDLISAAGMGHAGATMRLLDEVSESVPENILLHEVWLAPASKPLMEREPMKREKNKLMIQGQAKDPAALPVWVGRLGAIEGIHKARLEFLERDPSGGAPFFRIMIELS